MILENSSLNRQNRLNHMTPVLTLVDQQRTGVQLQQAIIIVSSGLLLAAGGVLSSSYMLYGVITPGLYGAIAALLIVYLGALWHTRFDLAQSTNVIGQLQLFALKQQGRLFMVAFGATLLFVGGRIVHGHLLTPTLLWALILLVIIGPWFLFITASLLRKRLGSVIERLGIFEPTAAMIESLACATFVLITDELVLESESCVRTSFEEVIKELKVQGLQVIYLSSYEPLRALEIAQQAGIAQQPAQVLPINAVNDVCTDDPRDIYKFFAATKVFASVTSADFAGMIALLKQCTRSIVLISNVPCDASVLQLRLALDGVALSAQGGAIMLHPSLALILNARKQMQACTDYFATMTDRLYIAIGSFFVVAQSGSFFQLLNENSEFLAYSGIACHALTIVYAYSFNGINMPEHPVIRTYTYTQCIHRVLWLCTLSAGISFGIVQMHTVNYFMVWLSTTTLFLFTL